MWNRMMNALLVIDNAVRRRCRHARDGEELKAAMRCLRAGVLNGSVQAMPGDKPDPEIMVAAYIEAGGDWQALVGAVSRHSLDGSTRRDAG